MTDRELLELAAKAAGIELQDYCTKVAICYYDHATNTAWNPLTYDSAALRLAVKLDMNLCITRSIGSSARAECQDRWVNVPATSNDDLHAATRRAIVLAAAEIGKGMK